jgi:hypothetical protein
VTILEVLDIILKESESLSLDSAADRKRLRDNFEYLMRSQRPDRVIETRVGEDLLLFRLK